jgi:hypothetical protein
MYIEKKMTLIALSDAKKRFKSGFPIYYFYLNKVLPAIFEEDLKAGNVFIKEEIKYPNELVLSELQVTKHSDGSHTFGVQVDYDVYSTNVSAEDLPKLIEFLNKPYKSEEG